jgi:hypothetical protein
VEGVESCARSQALENIANQIKRYSIVVPGMSHIATASPAQSIAKIARRIAATAMMPRMM